MLHIEAMMHFFSNVPSTCLRSEGCASQGIAQDNLFFFFWFSQDTHFYKAIRKMRAVIT